MEEVFDFNAFFVNSSGVFTRPNAVRFSRYYSPHVFLVDGINEAL